MARMIVVYKTPKDPDVFDEHYYGKHIPLAKKLPGIRKYEVSRGPVVQPSGIGLDTYMIATLHFDDLEAMQRAFASEEGKACAADRRLFAPDPSTFQMFLFDDEEV